MMAFLEGASGLALERVLSPVAIGGVRVKDRVVRTAHGTSMGHGGLSEALIEPAPQPARVLVVGEAEAPGFLSAAIATGHAAARNL